VFKVIGTSTVIGAEVVVPPPPFADTTLTGPLPDGPAPVPITCTVKVQELATAIVTPVRLTLLSPTTADTAPPHVLVIPFATTSPAGKASLNATPVSATVLAAGLVSV
jgi:hypothetical protein